MATTSAEPDTLGIAEIQFIAPSSAAATLEIRASADLAADEWLGVSVSARGFGAIAATAIYTGARAPTSLEVELFDGVPCTQLSSSSAVRSATIPSGGGIATFSGLPAGDIFALRSTALGTGNLALATGCVDALELADGETDSVEVPFRDLPLVAAGGYSAVLALDLGPVPTSRRHNGSRR